MEQFGVSPANDHCFSWVMVHAWSRFRRDPAGGDLLSEERGVDQEHFTAGSERGYSPALWVAERLDSHVKLVTPAEWLLLVRLRLRPRATLSRWLAESSAAGKDARVLADVERLLRSADKDQSAARRCFDRLKEAWG